MNDEKRNSFIGIPGAIIVAGAIVAIAIIWTRKPVSVPVSTLNSRADTVTNSANAMKDVTNADHILGNPNALVKIVEYSDPSCPYCKSWNPIMNQLMNEYGPGGKVAWVYRHFPLDKPDANGNVLHPNAGRESQALECAASLGGNEKFWAFEKRLYEVTPSVTSQTPKGLDQAQLPEIAKYIGLDSVSFNECLASGQFKDKVEKQFLDGINAGVSGTPYSIIVTPSGSKIPIVGLVSYSTLKASVEALLTGGQ